MSGGLGFLDIILFAMLAAFLVYRLGSVLGKRTGNEQQRPDIPGAGAGPDEGQEANVISLADRSLDPENELVEAASPLDAAITQIKLADRSFDEEGFVTGARMAFEMVVESFAGGDTATLRNILSDDVYENFAAAIHDRVSKDQTHETTMVGFDVTEIIEAEVEGRNALVTVKYISDQVNVTRDAAGETIEGDPAAVTRITDIWTFARDVSSSSPNWVLIATRSPN
jgi:predicted lipid-binding transport protein (Tim44 family)